MEMQTVYIGMGGNVESRAGSPEKTLAAAVERLRSFGEVVRRSSLYSTEPVGFAEQPRFVNDVVALETELDAHKLLQALLGIEQEFGRDRSTGFANGPRTLDLDILLFANTRISEPNLEIPHPRWKERAFVLVPLGEIAPQLVDAESGKTVSQLVNSLHSNTKGETDAVVPLQSESWRAASENLRADGSA
jgi:2-amino-4-hydroxy-6-hydroxymethyldihydropteridine diphosphokinase